MNGFDASSPAATISSVGAVAPAVLIRFQDPSVASASTIMIATSWPPSAVVTTRPATTMSNTARSRSECFGNATHCPSISATRTPPIGPENGSPEIWVDSDAALIATTS